MSAPEEVLADSPADFDSSFAYALHGEMRRLLIAAIVGSLLFPLGLAMFIDPGLYYETGPPIARRAIGLVAGLVGATLFYGGVVGALFKLVTDANLLAASTAR